MFKNDTGRCRSYFIAVVVRVIVTNQGALAMLAAVEYSSQQRKFCCLPMCRQCRQFHVTMYYQWIGLRDNVQETIDFHTKYGGFPVHFALNQSIDTTCILRRNFHGWVSCWISLDMSLSLQLAALGPAAAFSVPFLCKTLHLSRCVLDDWRVEWR